MPRLVEFDVEPQQVLVGEQPGVQVLTTINMENLLDLVVRHGEGEVARCLGEEMIKLLKGDKDLPSVIDVDLYMEQLVISRLQL